jgi:subtilisin family serine protease
VPGGRLNLEKIADSSGAFYWSYAIAAMSDIADGDLGIKVLNYSISSSSFYQAFYESVAALEAVGVVVVAAAANCDVENCRDGNNDEFPVYPANFELPHILSVAGSTQDDSLNSYSHYGPQTVDLAAPGVDLCSLDISSNTATITASGTSYATPIVAGVVAIVQGVFPELTPAEVVRVIRASAKPVAGLSGKVLSGGRLDVAAALEMAVPRLLEPEDGMGTLGIVNVGASGKASLVIFIEGVEILGAEGWEFKNFEQGEMLRLPEGGELVAPMGGAVLTQNLEPGESRAVLELRAVETGVFSGTVRAVMESSGVMQSPIDAGIEDPSGEWAWEFTVRVEAKDSASQNSEAKEEAPACGCQSGSASLLLLLGALSRGLSRGRV